MTTLFTIKHPLTQQEINERISEAAYSTALTLMDFISKGKLDRITASQIMEPLYYIIPLDDDEIENEQQKKGIEKDYDEDIGYQFSRYTREMFNYAEQYSKGHLSPWREKSFTSFLEHLWDTPCIDREDVFESIYDKAQYYYLVNDLDLLDDERTNEQRSRAYSKTMVQDCDAGMMSHEDIGKHSAMADILELNPIPDYYKETRAYRNKMMLQKENIIPAV